MRANDKGSKRRGAGFPRGRRDPASGPLRTGRKSPGQRGISLRDGRDFLRIGYREATDPDRACRLHGHPGTTGTLVRFYSFKENKGVISRIAGLLVQPFPFFNGIKSAAGELPIEEVDLLPLVAIGLHHDIFLSAADSFD